MSEFDSDSESSCEIENVRREPSKFAVSVIKHLVEARKIMEGHNYEHQITKCIYQQPLTNNPAFVIVRSTNAHNIPLANNKLVVL